MTSRRIWKDEMAMKKYGTSYATLCGDRKRIIDQMYVLFEMERDESKGGCR